MAKVGQVVTIPTGSYCNLTLDSGEKLIVNHETGAGGAGGRLTIDRLKLLGFSSEAVARIELDTPEGQRVLASLAQQRSAVPAASPLRLLVAYIQGAPSVAEVVARCRALVDESR